MPLRVLVVASETAEQCEARREYAGAASHESYAETLRQLRPDLKIESVSCVDGAFAPSVEDLEAFDGIFFAGSPIQMHEDTLETRLAAAFMTRVFDSGTPSFGSCAGLQIAAVAAGGTTGSRSIGLEAAFARNITKTDEGRIHPLLYGRPLVWMAPAMHSSVVIHLPLGATVLARNPGTPVEAAEIRHGRGVFWGVQYHPELTLAEIASALRRQAEDLVKEGLALDQAGVEDHAGRLETLARDPNRSDLAWQLGLDQEVTEATSRLRELENFLHAIETQSTRLPL